MAWEAWDWAIASGEYWFTAIDSLWASTCAIFFETVVIFAKLNENFPSASRPGSSSAVSASSQSLFTGKPFMGRDVRETGAGPGGRQTNCCRRLCSTSGRRHRPPGRRPSQAVDRARRRRTGSWTELSACGRAMGNAQACANPAVQSLRTIRPESVDSSRKQTAHANHLFQTLVQKCAPVPFLDPGPQPHAPHHVLRPSLLPSESTVRAGARTAPEGRPPLPRPT